MGTSCTGRGGSTGVFSVVSFFPFSPRFPSLFLTLYHTFFTRLKVLFFSLFYFSTLYIFPFFSYLSLLFHSFSHSFSLALHECSLLFTVFTLFAPIHPWCFPHFLSPSRPVCSRPSALADRVVELTSSAHTHRSLVWGIENKCELRCE